MPDLDDEHDQAVALDQVDNPVVAYAHSKERTSLELLRSSWIGVLCQSENVRIDAAEDVSGKLGEVAPRSRRDFNAAGHFFSPSSLRTRS